MSTAPAFPRGAEGSKPEGGTDHCVTSDQEGKPDPGGAQSDRCGEGNAAWGLTRASGFQVRSCALGTWCVPQMMGR